MNHMQHSRETFSTKVDRMITTATVIIHLNANNR